MAPSPPPWQLALARLEGALPFLGAEVGQGLALASLRRLWRVHVRDFPQENQGPEHNPGLEAAELTRSWYANERRDFLSWCRLTKLTSLHRTVETVPCQN